MSKPKILFVCDVKGWAWWCKALILKENLANDFEIVLTYLVGPGAAKDVNKKAYDLYFTFGYAYVPYLKGLPKNKIITGMTAHRDWKKVLPAMSKAIAVHANSMLLFNELKKYHPRVYYVPNGVNEKLFKPIIPIPAKRDNIIVGHVGKLTPLKCQKEVIEPAVKLAKAKYFAHYNNYMDALPHEKMVNLYQKFDVMTCASKDDATPNPCCIKRSPFFLKEEVKNIEDIKEGDLALTHKGRYKKVTKCYQKPYSGEILKIFSILNNPFSCTPNHPILVVRGKQCYKNKSRNIKHICKPSCKDSSCKHKYYEGYCPEFLPASELNKYDMVLSPREKIRQKTKASKVSIRDFNKGMVIDKEGKAYFAHGIGKQGKVYKCRDEIEITPGFMRLLGYFLAEGSLSRGYVISFAINVTEEEFRQDIINQMFLSFDVLPDKDYVNKNCRSVRYCSKGIGSILESFCGKGAHEKRISEFIYNQPDNLILELLKGFFIGDGHLRHIKRNISLTTVSKRLVYQFKRLLLRIGVACNLRTRINKKAGVRGNDLTSYSLIIGEPYVNKLLELWNDPRKLDSFSVAYNKHYIDDNYLYSPITSIEKIQYSGDVYNFEVEEDHSYCVEGQAVHNCLEAAACGRPIISVRIGNMPEFIKDGYNGYLIPRNINTMAERISFLRDHRKILMEMGNNARKTVEEGWTWKIQAENYRKMLWDIINNDK